MGKITLSTSLEDFASFIVSNHVNTFLTGSNKKMNSYFIYLSVCNEKEVVNAEKESGKKEGNLRSSSNKKIKEVYRKYKIYYEDKDSLGEELKICKGWEHLNVVLSNKADSINFLAGDNKMEGFNEFRPFSKGIVSKCKDLKSLFYQIEHSGSFSDAFVKHVKDEIKPVFEHGIFIKEDEINDKNFKQKSVHQKIKHLVNNDFKQIILTGPPGTGKTYIAQKLSKELGEEVDFNNFVQFHPSFDYVDFIEGIRPFENTNHEMIFRKTDGIFKSFCRYIAELNKNEENQSKKYFFIIDEINRADLSKVFGELLFALEEDKRGQKIATQYSQLPTYYYNEEASATATYEEDIFKEGFFVPENVFILATMNDIDRSVEQIDFAFRRRFKWIQVNVEEQSLRDAFESGEFVDSEHINGVIEAITHLNKFIKEKGKEFQLNENYFISQGYFKNLNKQGISDLNRVLEHAWDIRIKLTIAEYVRGEINSEVFLEQAKNTFLSPSISTDPIES